MINRLFLVLFTIVAALKMQAADGDNDCPVVRIVPERLPDMTMPRSGHCMFYVNGELTVAGGHTTNFVVTPTAERLADGEWLPMDMAYPHDNGFAAMLRSGEVIIGGGHSEELGVGQTYTLERYQPDTHQFEGFGCLDRRRVLANAVQLADGRVIISGNHYASDAVGCYDGQSQVAHLKDVRQGRCNPFILPIAHDDAIIVGANDVYDRPVDTIWVDRLKGDAFRVPLLEQWRVVFTDQPFCSAASQTGAHSYLLSVVRCAESASRSVDGQLGFVEVSDTCFTLLSTTCPVPMDCEFGPIFYKGPAVVDSLRRRAYVLGVDSLFQRQYLLAVDYAERPARLTLYYADNVGRSTITIPVLTPDGDLLLVGGIDKDNYKPHASVWLYHFATNTQAADNASTGSLFLWVALAAVVLACAVCLLMKRRHPASEQPTDLTPQPSDDQLMERIGQLMELDQRYLTHLKLSDVAIELGVSVPTINECVSRHHGGTFAQLLAAYRVRHAQRLLSEQPDMKLASLIAQSGFSSETTFFRSFKALTGMSPKEWLESGTTPISPF